ncbi:MAG: hypothetical protein KAR54_02600 [Candidatus Pacebacteria bacterium]|nr:hypothetical protein [Candidatus Paceibacterota bacterium]
MNSVVSQVISRNQGHELVSSLEKAGVKSELAQKVIESKNNLLAEKIVDLIKNGGFEPTTSLECARKIMGKNFFGFDEAIKHFKVIPSSKQFTYFNKVPWSQEVLEFCKDTHVLIAVFPISIFDIFDRVDQALFYDNHRDKNLWFNDQGFMRDKSETGWYLVHKTPVTESDLEKWNKKGTLLVEKEKIPEAKLVVYTIIGHYLATGERLFKNISVSTFMLPYNRYNLRVCQSKTKS